MIQYWAPWLDELQWGHVFSDVEMSCTVPCLPKACRASMGPRLFRRGNSLAAAELTEIPTASMGPRLFRRGNRVICAGNPPTDELQWGHVFSDVEIVAAWCFGVRNGRASMGPRLFRRGNMVLFFGRGDEETASMGPRLFRRGNTWMKHCPEWIGAASMGPRLFRRGNG